MELLKGISESQGLEESYVNEKMAVESLDSHQLLVASIYPPCPQPELAMGLPPHPDHGLLTILMQKEVAGLQVMHNGKWVPINSLIPNSFFVHTGDHMEILTKGKYKSVVHRAVVYNEATGISRGTAHGPPLGTIESPAPERVADSVGQAYLGIKYREYLELQHRKSLNGKSCLDQLRPAVNMISSFALYLIISSISTALLL